MVVPVLFHSFFCQLQFWLWRLAIFLDETINSTISSDGS